MASGPDAILFFITLQKKIFLFCVSVCFVVDLLTVCRDFVRFSSF